LDIGGAGSVPTPCPIRPTFYITFMERSGRIYSFKKGSASAFQKAAGRNDRYNIGSRPCSR
jgi:hypothetical protein